MASISANALSFFHMATQALPLLLEAPAARVVTAGSFLADVDCLDASPMRLQPRSSSCCRARRAPSLAR